MVRFEHTVIESGIAFSLWVRLRSESLPDKIKERPMVMPEYLSKEGDGESNYNKGPPHGWKFPS